MRKFSTVRCKIRRQKWFSSALQAAVQQKLENSDNAIFHIYLPLFSLVHKKGHKAESKHVLASSAFNKASFASGESTRKRRLRRVIQAYRRRKISLPKKPMENPNEKESCWVEENEWREKITVISSVSNPWYSSTSSSLFWLLLTVLQLLRAWLRHRHHSQKKISHLSVEHLKYGVSGWWRIQQIKDVCIRTFRIYRSCAIDSTHLLYTMCVGILFYAPRSFHSFPVN